jgi:hypothetical protein
MKSEQSQLPDKEGEVNYYNPKVDNKLDRGRESGQWTMLLV